MNNDKKKSNGKIATSVTATLASLLLAACTTTTSNAPLGEWRYHGGDAGSSKYIPLDQINAENVSELKNVWTWNSPDDALVGKVTKQRPSFFKATPLYVDGKLFTCTSFSQVTAIDPETGATIWNFDPEAYKEKFRPANTGWQNRGVAYWSGEVNGQPSQRIYIATGTGDLIALDADTGKPIADFGNKGRVDIQEALVDNEDDRRFIGFNSPPIVVDDVVVLGGVIYDRANTVSFPAGDIQAFDARTGERRWNFHVVPREGELGTETWENDSWKLGGASNAWAPISADPELGIVYIGTSTPNNDFWGGDRPGDNLFAETLLALEARTGKRLWHFQAIHHGLWDYDLNVAPTLADITVDGKAIKAIATVSKQGFTYVFDRITGEPVWPIEERPVPQSKVPGEKTAATQPFPTKPPAFTRQGITPDDLIDFTPEMRQAALDATKDYEFGPLYTPPILLGENGKKGVLMAPSAGGGANWAGAGFDPDTGYLYLDVSHSLGSIAVTKNENAEKETGEWMECHTDTMRQQGCKKMQGDPKKAQPLYHIGPSFAPRGPNGLPLIKPPYATVTAIDLNKGEIAWAVPHGDGPINNPAIKDLNLPPLGAARQGLSGSGPLVTKTLLFMNQVQSPGMYFNAPSNFLRAFDKRSGNVIWELAMDEPPHGIPMSFMHKGKQYIVVGTGGAGFPGRLQAYALDL